MESFCFRRFGNTVRRTVDAVLLELVDQNRAPTDVTEVHIIKSLPLHILQYALILASREPMRQFRFFINNRYT